MTEFQKLDLSAIKGILVDIDNTLYDYTSAHHAALKHTRLIFEVPHPKRVSTDKFNRMYRACRSSVTSRLEGQGACRSRLLAFQQMLEELNIPNAYVLAECMERRYWDTLIMEMKPNQQLIEWLSDVREKGIRICAVTNMQAGIQIRKLKHLGISGIVDHLVTSEEVGHEKPHPDMFDTALAKLRVKPGEALMIGDDQCDDVLGAERVGIRSCQIKTYL